MAVGFNNYIYACYKPRYFEYVFNVGSNSPVLSESGAFKKYMKVSLDDDIIEIPCCYIDFITHILAQNNYIFRKEKTGNIIKEVCVSLEYLNRELSEIKTSLAALKALFYYAHPSENLKLIHIGDVKYLGNPGIIMYDDFTPIVLFTLQLERVKYQLTEDTFEYKYTPIKQIVRINKDIYNRDDIIAKYIRSKFITNLINMTESYYTYAARLDNTYGIFKSCALDYKFKIVIDLLSDLFVSPSVPNSSFSSDKVNEFLSNNKEIILNSIE